MMRPFLQVLSDGKVHAMREVSDQVAKLMEVGADARAERLPSAAQSRWTNRIAWVGTHFNFAGLIVRPARGRVQITDRGLQVLKHNPDRVDLRTLRQFPEYLEARRRKHNAESEEEAATDGEESATPPLETLERSYQELRKALAAELLDLVKSKPPAFFERLVLQLMQRLGYGSLVDHATQHLGGSGDGGLDGLIKEDKLGLDVIYVQAKRWESPVGSKIVREFLGALDQAGAKKGVLITTSSFTQDARAPLGKTDKKIALIDGDTLAELMIEHDLGVAPSHTFLVKKVDSDFFEED